MIKAILLVRFTHQRLQYGGWVSECVWVWVSVCESESESVWEWVCVWMSKWVWVCVWVCEWASVSECVSERACVCVCVCEWGREVSEHSQLLILAFLFHKSTDIFRAVWGVHTLLPLKHWGRLFESQSRHFLRLCFTVPSDGPFLPNRYRFLKQIKQEDPGYTGP
jgi:hypothetical protein